MKSVHIWGSDDWSGRLDGAAPSTMTVSEHLDHLAAHARQHGGAIQMKSATRTLDGLLVAVEFATPERDGCDAMWHQIIRPQEVWPAPKEDNE